MTTPTSPRLIPLFWNYSLKAPGAKEKLLTYLQQGQEEFAECLKVFRDREGLMTCWFNAVRGNDEAVVMEFIRVGMDIDHKATGTEESAILIACELGLEPMVQLLLNLHVNVNTRDKQHNSPLMKAAYGGYSNILRLLLDHGADINAVSKCGETGLLLACVRNRVDCVALLLTAGAAADGVDRNGATCLMHAACRGYYAIIDLFATISSNISVNERNGKGRTALCLAVRSRQVRAVYSLLNLDADRSIQDCDKKTVFDYANNNKEMMDALESVDDDIGFLLK